MIKMKVYENWREYYSDPDVQRINQRYSGNCWHMDGKPPFRDPESYPLFGEKIELYVQKKKLMRKILSTGNCMMSMFLTGPTGFL